ncbi:hypothetical protein DY000_02052923 [Brassica cretica]|uniref:Uncharacterized protein n=1 Tax=Brassica cretica TaxID=69181 RepID=A0ABQ7ABE8_BRACR|nr:hypothetical protein DY000_02052923 [Brassica cretica]
MSRRLTYSEKGKGLATPESPPRRGRVKLPDYDISDLLRKHELTLIAKAKLRVLINGLRPLITTSTIEFANGDEVVATLVIVKKDITKKAPSAKEMQVPRQSYTSTGKSLTSGADHRQTSGFMRDARRSGTGRHVPAPRAHQSDRASFEDDRRRLNSSQSIQDRRTPEKEYRAQINSPGNRASIHQNFEPYETVPATSRSREKTTNLMQQVPENVNIEALNEAREEIRGVMQQYVNCADPSESAARKERVRLANEK